MSEKIAIVDDEIDIREGVAKYLTQNHYQVDAYEDGLALLGAIPNKSYSLIILDVMMPKIDGLETCKRLRKITDVPVIFLSAAGEAFDRILGLEVGGDDYLTKPFNSRELLARIKTITRRYQPAKKVDAIIETNDWMVDLEKRIITYPDGQEVKMQSAIYELLAYLNQHRGKVISREKLFEDILKRPFEEFDRSIDLRVSRLRKLFDINREKDNSYIETVVGAGYILHL
jgi:DNA-binding response OmpR family regulator